jgi:hypothetical protein
VLFAKIITTFFTEVLPLVFVFALSTSSPTVWTAKLSVFWRELMPMDAMCLLALRVSFPLRNMTHVVCIISQFKMIWVRAFRGVALVQNEHPSRDFAFMQDIRKPMRPY